MSADSLIQFEFEERLSDSLFIEKIWRTQSQQAGMFISMAVSHWEMVITQYHGEVSVGVRGPETHATLADVPPEADFWGIQFKLGAFMPQFPVQSLVNNGILLPSASCGSFWLQSSTWQLPTFDNVETFVARMVREELLVQDPLVAAALAGQPVDLSTRSIQRRFLRATGLTWGEIAQIARAKHARTLLEQGVSILDTVYQAGYADQPHLTRSLKRFLGQTPAQILSKAE